MARARIEDAAAAAGVTLRRTDAAGVLDALRSAPADVLLVDLDAGGEAVLAELARARAEGISPRRVLGYFSHVDEALGRAARAAGCEALPRGRFWRTLPALLARAVDEREPED